MHARGTRRQDRDPWSGLAAAAVMAVMGLAVGEAASGAAVEDPAAESGVEARSEREAFDWQVITHDGREYVTARRIAAFYRFDRYLPEGWRVWLRSPTVALRLEVESAVALVNDTKFMMLHPVLQPGGELMVSRVDLVKWLDPILRPRYIRRAPSFDTVVIDPGHGGIDNGTRGIYGDEKVFTLDLALHLKRELVRRGLKVIMTRETDALPSKWQRAELASAIPDSILLSLHFNQSRGGTVQGLETYAMTPQGQKSSNDLTLRLDEARFGYTGNVHDSASLALATAVHAEILHQCRPDDRGIRRARWAVLKESERPGILVEGGYISHPYEAMRIKSPEYRSRMASAIADGVVNYRRALQADE